MEFGINKFEIIILKRANIVRSTGVILPEGKFLKAINDEGFKYLGIL